MSKKLIIRYNSDKYIYRVTYQDTSRTITNVCKTIASVKNAVDWLGVEDVEGKCQTARDEGIMELDL